MRSRVGDPAATLADDPKRSVNGAGTPEVVCSSAEGLELTDPVNFGVGRPRDKMTAVVFAHALLSSGLLMNTIYGPMLVGGEEGAARTIVAKRPLSWGMVQGGRG